MPVILRTPLPNSWAPKSRADVSLPKWAARTNRKRSRQRSSSYHPRGPSRLVQAPSPHLSCRALVVLNPKNLANSWMQLKGSGYVRKSAGFTSVPIFTTSTRASSLAACSWRYLARICVAALRTCRPVWSTTEDIEYRDGVSSVMAMVKRCEDDFKTWYIQSELLAKST